MDRRSACLVLGVGGEVSRLKMDVSLYAFAADPDADATSILALRRPAVSTMSSGGMCDGSGRPPASPVAPKVSTSQLVACPMESRFPSLSRKNAPRSPVPLLG
jgi:hypothetical protein